MQRFILLALAVLFAFVFLHSRAFAQAQNPSTAFEQKTYVYEPWIKGKFSELVTVKNPGKWIFLAGIGPESGGEEAGGGFPEVRVAVVELHDVGVRLVLHKREIRGGERQLHGRRIAHR